MQGRIDDRPRSWSSFLDNKKLPTAWVLSSSFGALKEDKIVKRSLAIFLMKSKILKCGIQMIGRTEGRTQANMDIGDSSESTSLDGSG